MQIFLVGHHMNQIALYYNSQQFNSSFYSVKDKFKFQNNYYGPFSCNSGLTAEKIFYAADQ